LPYIFNHRVEVRGDGSKVNGLNGTDIDNAIQIVITFSVTEKGANKQITLFQNQGRVSYIVE